MRRISFLLLLAAVATTLFPTRIVFAASQPDIRVLDASGTVKTIFTPYDDEKSLIGSVAVADLGDDGEEEILVGAGEDHDPTVSVFRQDGSLIGTFAAYDVGYRGGVNVAACDLDSDGVNEVVTGAAWNGGPHVRVFDNMGTVKNGGFFAFDQSFRGGVNVACGDVTGDGVGDIIVGAGLGGGPDVKIFSMTGDLITEKFVDSATKNTGVFVAVDNGKIVTTTMGYEAPTMTVWAFDQTTHSLEASSSVTSSLMSPQLIAPMTSSTYVTQGYVEPAVVTLAKDGSITSTTLPFSSDATHAISAAPITKNGTLTGYAVANTAPKMSNDLSAKSILIDKSQQRLTTYEYGVPMHTFLVSTARNGWATPLGKTTVRTKLLYHTYKWTRDNGSTYDYNIPDVKWNLRIYDHIYIHWAWWHNNFGQPVSHGCVNANAENAEWIFNFAEVGTPVNIVN
jgi:lipoprotein-anchoring transpeptidase ErfK/SrfK